jgi:hypothetical protein
VGQPGADLQELVPAQQAKGFPRRRQVSSYVSRLGQHPLRFILLGKARVNR